MTKLPLLVAVRALVLVAVVGALGVGAIGLARPPLAAAVARPHDIAFPGALEALCAALLVAGWLWLQVAAVSLAVAAGARLVRRPRLATLADRVASRTAPAAMRRLVIAGCGVALSTGAVVLPASAMTRAAPHTAPAASSRLQAPDVTGLPLPDRAAGPHLPGGPADPRQRWLTVLPGDSLWAITRRLLPADADDQKVAGACHRLASANRTAIGVDPDLILPGTRLRVPDHLYRRELT
jgi:nucleoid-associated protein YgaU